MMGSIRFCANTQLRNTVISTLKPMRNHSHCCSLNRKIYYLQSQQRVPQVNQHSDILLYNTKVANERNFSMTCVLAKSKDRGKDKKKQKTQHIDYNEMGQVVNVDNITSQFEKAIEGLKNDFVKYLSVRSAVGAIEELTVKFEDKNYTLQELAQISRKPKLIVLDVSTFPQTIPEILKSLLNNQMKLNPQQDGTTIYLPIPKVTKEHRETLFKNAKSFYVKCCDNIRDIRNKEIKVVKRKEGLAKDVAFRIENNIDGLSRQYMATAEQMLETKQKDLFGDSD
ncbi:hypothetical protein DMN91_001813 [Ooceraea biroi]|uniref:Ribosome-recycling factor, mitochondrial n=1 Tax=Ooceraea biroi TaxID=2015173 RepID=A0A026WXH6_OOCBI|nr:ribosome-recycling factor, mitochondrial [Ooceraea biroi]EZA60760.1 Ribosome-recycling factor, mitochondrial [Ooceraea biroi]RLU25656.1 hypothetical protein DMN91_001813 [Ooceraea biroi]